MRYKLYNENYKYENIIHQMLYNRGIFDPEYYTSLDESCLCSYKHLSNIDHAVRVYLNAIENNVPILIIVDEDVDGWCSGAITYKLTKQLGATNVKYALHKRAKSHGITDDIEIPDDIKLLIVPDAGSNDVKKCKELSKKMDIIILDHHEIEFENPYAIIVNNQCSPMYNNKNLCGAGIVYKFFQAVDEETWNEFADDYLDLVALANIADNMDIREPETRYLIELGLKNIRNKGFISLINSLEYSMSGKINIHNIQFYPVPTMNGCIRIGSYDEKELLFRSFIEDEEFFEYKKRATKNNPAEIIQESIYDRAARLSKNAKSRQDKLRIKSLENISEIIDSIPFDDKIIVVDATNVVDTSLTGVVAIKVAEKYNKPCILLQRKTPKDGEEVTYGGSGRNFDNSPISSLKDLLNSTGLILAQGHQNAHGVMNLKESDIEKLINKLNHTLANVDFTPIYLVDFEFDVNDITPGSIYELSKMEDFIGTKIEEPMIKINNIKVSPRDVSVVGKQEDTIKFMYNDVEYCWFKCKDGNCIFDFINNTWEDSSIATINLIGKAGINEYNGLKKPQVIIVDAEIVKQELDIDEDDVW